MRGVTARIMVAGVLGATLALGSPLAAYADSGTTTTTIATINTPANGWVESENTFVDHRHSIRVTYEHAVKSAKAAFNAAMARARSGQARSQARAALLNAIANAYAVQMSALAALGSGPPVQGNLNDGEFRLQRQAINQEFFDTVDALQATYQAEVAAATNSAQLVTARANLKLGIAEATTQRSDELVTLGARPTLQGSQSQSTTTAKHGSD